MSFKASGRFTKEKLRPGTFSLYDRTMMAQKHLAENCDRRFNCVPYVGATLGEDPPHFNHHPLDYTEAMPYSIYGWVMARDITGSNLGLDIQDEQNRLYLSFFSHKDGLIRPRKHLWGDITHTDLWEQARALYALCYNYMYTGDQTMIEMADKIVDTLFALSIVRGGQRMYPVDMLLGGQSELNQGLGQFAAGSLIDPLVKVYQLTANPRAYALAQGLTNFFIHPMNGFFDEEGVFEAYYRAVVAVINGISNFAVLTGQPHLIDRAKQIHDYAISIATAFGSTPCDEPACSNMELNHSAMALIQAGYDEYWDQIDRFTRNQTAEAQFTDPNEWVREKAVSGQRITDKNGWVTAYYPEDLHMLPYDDYNDVVNRCVGGFFWTTVNENLYIPGTLMLCCAGHGLRAYHLAYRNALTEDITGISANLHLSMENSLGEIISYEPYQGRVDVILNKDTYNLKIRIPKYAPKDSVRVFADDQPCGAKNNGGFIHIDHPKPGKVYSITFDLNERTTTENHIEWHRYANHGSMDKKIIPFETHWKGNTVLSLSPESREEKRLYKREHMKKTGDTPMKQVSYFIPHREIRW